MRVVIAGGTGFLGAAVVAALVRRGDEVTILSRSAEKVRREFGSTVEARQWDPSSPGAWSGVLIGADAVLNLSGEQVVKPTQPWTATEKAKIRRSRIGTTAALAAAVVAADPRPPVFVNASAIGYYGDRGAEILTEASSPGTDFLAQLVVDWEAAAAPVAAAGVRLVLIRTGIVVGKGGGALTQMLLPFKLFMGGPMGRPEQWVSWVHIDDYVNLILRLLETDDIAGPVNITAPEPVTMQTFAEKLGAALHRPSWFPLYGTFFKVGMGQRAKVVLGSQRVLPEIVLGSGYTFTHPEIGEALRDVLS